ncbi:efflux transporter outer membrane subunit [Sphingomonas sp.]|uniref:efflux transporter outer membrane subunit n=1 Tax=Sphingomonas sp. TaxID=28214 RepID=UPI002BED681A|nr:efflux transporter outer membrane subunit [Sphingomonas sp.]HWK36299.1 efflux transporter outer membrane subunit [Sphingomonas sp.]
MIRPLLPLAALGLLAGCSLAPEYDRPAAPVPSSWPVGDSYLRQDEAGLPTVSYRDIFHDARLQALVEQALANNRDLRVAAANIAAARGAYRSQRGALFPTISAGASAGASDGGVSATSAGGGTRESYAANVGTTAFELDLFGRVRSLSRAALDEYFATEAAARATRLALVGDIADAWLAYAADKSLLAIAEDTAKSAGESVRLTRLRLEGGIAPRTDLRQAELVEAQAKSDLATQRTALAQDVNLLQLLVGAPIDPARLPGSIDQAAPTLAELPAGLDSGVLLRRPDVVQAEYQLRAANARIGAARAALFPRISLTGLVGLASNALGSLFTGDAFTWSATGAAAYNIFDGGSARGDRAQTRAQRDAAVASYEKAIQTAFREVSDALARRGTIADQESAQTNLVAAAQDNYNLSTARYRGGIDTFLQSLDAQRSFYSAQRSLVATRLARAQNLVALYRTLGGDALLDAAPDDPAAPR